MLDKPVVKQARRQGTAGAVTIGNQPYLVAAARLPILPDSAPMIVLGRARRHRFRRHPASSLRRRSRCGRCPSS